MIIKDPEHFMKWVTNLNSTTNSALIILKNIKTLNDEINSGKVTKECIKIKKNLKIDSENEKAILELIALFEIQRNYNKYITELKLTKRL